MACTLLTARTCSPSALFVDAFALLCLGGCGLLGIPIHVVSSETLETYKDAHYRALGTAISTTLEWPQFLSEARQARVLFLGDHHTDKGLHVAYLDLLQRLFDADIEITLGLEAIGRQDEPKLLEYLSGKIPLQSFRRQIRRRWRNSWLDSSSVDAEFFVRLITLARERGLPTYALEPAPRLPLLQRDSIIALRIEEILASEPNRLLVVVIGHAHLLGEDHLANRTQEPHVLLCPRMSDRLKQSLDAQGVMQGTFLRSDAGVLFFNQNTLSIASEAWSDGAVGRFLTTSKAATR